MNTLLLIVLGIAGFILVKAALYAAIRQTVAGCRWIATRYRAICVRWRQRRPPPPPALTAPLTRWDEHDIPTWRRRGQTPPALDTPAPGASPPPPAGTTPPGRVVF
jgi:hypothetical protein